MDHDHNSPIAQHFDDAAIELNDDATLYLSFSPLTKSVDFSVYDRSAGQGGDYTLKYQSGSDAKGFAKAVQDRYGVKVPAKTMKLVNEFDALARSIVPLQVDLDADNDGDSDISVCESCGSYNQDTIEAFYAPATATLPASVAFHWEYGCFGGHGLSGEATTEQLDALEAELKRAMEFAKSEDAVTEIDNFLAQLPR